MTFESFIETLKRAGVLPHHTLHMTITGSIPIECDGCGEWGVQKIDEELDLERMEIEIVGHECRLMFEP